MKLIHLTDTHLVPPPRRLYALDPQARLAAAVEDINRHHADAELVMISGDLADRGEPEAYRALHETLASLEVPYALGMGNHDSRPHLQAAFPELPQDANGFVQYVWETSTGVMVMLDSANPGTHAGELCALRLAWLDACLREHRSRDVFLVLHHPPLEIGIRYMDAINLRNADDLQAVLARHSNVRHIFFGHVHRPAAGSWHGIPFSTLPSLNHQVGLELSADADRLPGCHEPPAYGVVLIEAHSLVSHVHQFLSESRRYYFRGALERAQSLEELDDGIRRQRQDPALQVEQDD